MTPAVIQRWIDTLPSADTAHRCKKRLHTCLEEAVRMGLLPMNPAKYVKVPPLGPSAAAAWTGDEARRFLAVSEGHAYEPYWSLALRLAMRPCELVGLRWDAVDFEARTLTVKEGLATVSSVRFEGGPKSEAGNRTLDLPADLVALLKAHRARQRARRLELGALWRENNLVCTNDVGEPICHRTLTRAFKRLSARAGARDIRLYDLRHTAISAMAERGADIKAISEVAGHASVRITRNVYQHVNRKQRAAALDALTDAFTGPEPTADRAVSE
jgi:integrase